MLWGSRHSRPLISGDPICPSRVPVVTVLFSFVYFVWRTDCWDDNKPWIRPELCLAGICVSCHGLLRRRVPMLGARDVGPTSNTVLDASAMSSLLSLLGTSALFSISHLATAKCPPWRAQYYKGEWPFLVTRDTTNTTSGSHDCS